MCGTTRLRAVREARRLLTAVAIFFSMALAAPSSAQIAPIDLGVLPGHATSIAKAVNSSIEVVGFCENADYTMNSPFVWENGSMTPLPLPEGAFAGRPNDINCSGVVVGECGFTSELGTYSQACIWQREGDTWTVTLLPIPQGWQNSSAFVINDAGQVLVWLHYLDPETDIDYVGSQLRDTDGTLTELLSDGIPIWPWDLNASGQVLGTLAHWPQIALVWTAGSVAVIESVDTGQTVGCPRYMFFNDMGQVVGVFGSIGFGRSFVYQPDPVPSLTTYDAAVTGEFRGIDNQGRVLSVQVVIEGHVVGHSYFDLRDLSGDVTVPGEIIGNVPGFIQASGPFMNADGDITTYWAAEGVRGTFFGSVGTGLISLAGITPEGTAEPLGIGPTGAVVGYSPGTFGESHACLWVTNQPPVLDVSAAPSYGVAGVPLSFTATATGDDLSFSLGSNAPTGSSIDAGTGAFTWIPAAAGSYTFSVTVTDGSGATDTESVTIHVSALALSDAVVSSRNPKVMTLTVTLTNRTAATVSGTTLTAATLGGVATNSPLPLVFGAIKPGESKRVTLQFKGVSSGSWPLTIQGTTTGGSFFRIQSVTIP